METQIESGYASQRTNKLYQLQELQGLFDTAKKFVECKRQRVYHTWKYWAEVLQKMFDLREQRLVNFALKRWGIDQLPGEPATVRADKFAEGNEVFTIRLKQRAE